MRSGACSPALKASAHKRSSEVDQPIRKSSNTRTADRARRPRERPGDERSQLPSTHFLRRQFEVPIGRQRNVEQWREQGRVVARLDPH